jgi:hypothetical protein
MKEYATYQEIKEAVNNGVLVHWKSRRFHVSLLNDLYIIWDLFYFNYSQGKIELHNIDDFFTINKNNNSKR